MKEPGTMNLNGEEYIVIPKRDYTNITNLITDLVKYVVIKYFPMFDGKFVYDIIKSDSLELLRKIFNSN